MRLKTCPICRAPFAKQRMGQKACSIECAIALGQQAQEKNNSHRNEKQ